MRDEPRGRVLKEKRSKMVIIKTVFKICLLIHANHSNLSKLLPNILTLIVPSIKCCAQKVLKYLK
jgi:hypothetical protein